VTRGGAVHAGGADPRTLRSVDLLSTYVTAWRDTADRVLALLRDLPSNAWDRCTDCPGWRVRDIVAHLADIESQLAGADAAAVVRAAGDRRELTPDWTGPGVAARREATPAELVAELAEAVDRRATAFEQHPPDDPGGRPPVVPGGLGWDWVTLLRNRVVDLWVHEQDIRRAVGSPGGVSSPGAEVAVRTLAAALPYVLGKRVAPPAGTVLGIDVTGSVPLRAVLAVGADGRARPVDGDPPEGCTWLRTDTETFAVLAAGRRRAADVAVDVTGDHALALRFADALAVTP